MKNEDLGMESSQGFRQSQVLELPAPSTKRTALGLVLHPRLAKRCSGDTDEYTTCPILVWQAATVTQVLGDLKDRREMSEARQDLTS